MRIGLQYEVAPATTMGESMEIDDEEPCLSLACEYEYRFSEYEYNIYSPAPFRGFPQASRYFSKWGGLLNVSSSKNGR